MTSGAKYNDRRGTLIVRSDLNFTSGWGSCMYEDKEITLLNAYDVATKRVRS
jgi:hypothetical protein